MSLNDYIASDTTHRTVFTGEEGEIESGDPILCGQLPGVALTDESDDEYTTIDTAGVFTLTVKGAKAAITWGAPLYLKEGKITEEGEAKYFFGYALGTCEKEKEADIPVHVGH